MITYEIESYTNKKRTSVTPESKYRPKVNYRITPEEMWSCVKGSSMNWGIEGYEIPKHYYDYHQVKWQQERTAILERHKRVWPPQDWPKSKEDDKLVPPHRPNFVENYIKWANSFNDEKKSEEIKEALESRGTFKYPEPKKPLNLRDKFLNEEKEKKQKFAELPKIQYWKETPIENAKAHIEEQRSKEKTQIQKDKERYTKEKPQWPRCERVSVLAEAQHMGEKVPFYYTFTAEGEVEDKKKLFFPKKDFTWTRYPVWSFQNKSPIKLPNDNMIARDDLIKEKIENLKSNKNITDKDIMGDVIESYAKVKNRGRNYFKYQKTYDYANTDQYKLNKETFPEYSPGPEHYWKMKPKEFDKNERPKGTEEDAEIHGKPGKIYFMNHQRTDFRQYKPMKKSVF